MWYLGYNYTRKVYPEFKFNWTSCVYLGIASIVDKHLEGKCSSKSLGACTRAKTPIALQLGGTHTAQRFRKPHSPWLSEERIFQCILRPRLLPPACPVSYVNFSRTNRFQHTILNNLPWNIETVLMLKLHILGKSVESGLEPCSQVASNSGSVWWLVLVSSELRTCSLHEPQVYYQTNHQCIIRRPAAATWPESVWVWVERCKRSYFWNLFWRLTI